MDIKGFLLAGLQTVAAHTWYSCVHRDDDEETTLADEMDSALKGFVGVSKISGSASTYILNFTRADGSGSTSGSSKIHAFSMASQTLAGMMSAADKTKLDSLPTAASLEATYVTKEDANDAYCGVSTVEAGNNYVDLHFDTLEGQDMDEVIIGAATQSTAGVMSANDKAKLDNLDRRVFPFSILGNDTATVAGLRLFKDQTIRVVITSATGTTEGGYSDDMDIWVNDGSMEGCPAETNTHIDNAVSLWTNDEVLENASVSVKTYGKTVTGYIRIVD